MPLHTLTDIAIKKIVSNPENLCKARTTYASSLSLPCTFKIEEQAFIAWLEKNLGYYSGVEFLKGLRAEGLSFFKQLLGTWSLVAEDRQIKRDLHSLLNINLNNIPLHKAVSQEKTEHVFLLLELGIKVNLTDEMGSTSLHVAAQYGYIHLVNLLLNAGKDVINIQNAAGNTALNTAIIYRQAEVALRLITSNADVNIKNDCSQSPLHIIASYKDEKWLEVVNCLSQAGADINAKDKNNRTALHFAVMNDCGGMVVKLLRRGADPYIKDEYGHDVFYYVKKNVDILRYLNVETCVPHDSWKARYQRLVHGHADPSNEFRKSSPAVMKRR